jgi:hypothetical protein
MNRATVTAVPYAPAGFPPGTYTIVRRVKLSAAEVSADPRARRRRTIDPQQLPLALDGEITTWYACSFIVTNLRGDPVAIEAWFRNRGQIEERIKDSKLGMALRHPPSGRLAANQAWMWACLLTLNLSVWLQGLAGLDTDGRANGKRLRRELIRVPGRLAFHARQLIVHLHPDQWHRGPSRWSAPTTRCGRCQAHPSCSSPSSRRRHHRGQHAQKQLKVTPPLPRSSNSPPPVKLSMTRPRHQPSSPSYPTLHPRISKGNQLTRRSSVPSHEWPYNDVVCRYGCSGRPIAHYRRSA